MKYFNNPHTLEELKKQYKALALKYHPDCGGDTAIMQAVNAEYDELFSRLKNNNNVNVSTIMTLCEYLNCQPGDIMEYVPDDKAASDGSNN